LFVILALFPRFTVQRSVCRYAPLHSLYLQSRDYVDIILQIGDLLASISGVPSPAQSNHPLLPPKRKPSEGDSLRRPADKLQKTNVTPSRPADTSRPPTTSSRPGGVNTSMERMKLSAPGSNSRTPTTQISTSSSNFNHGQPTPPPNDQNVTSKAPKKGSFAEIMARGKQNAEKMGQVGKIQHKRIEKPLSKRERAELDAQKAAKMSKNIGPGGKFSNTPGAKAINGKMSVAGGSNGKMGKNGKAGPTEPEKKIKKAALATTGYAGTARPKPGAKPGQKSSHASSSRDRDRYGRKPPALGSRHDRYDSYEDDEEDLMEEDEEEDDQPDYESDVSSDMEAAAFEVDEEEELAAKIARKEDAEALAEENRLKREKAEKKKRLMAMAAKAGKRR
jgi:protein SPT2